MALRVWRFITVMLTALSTGLSFCHLLELPPRVFVFDAHLWISTTTKGLYYLFGTIGAGIEVGSVVSTISLAIWVRHRGLSFSLSLGAALLVVLALGLWFVFIAPVNAELATWTANNFPPDWTQYRNQWEYTHAVNAGIKILALALLVLSLLVEIPNRTNYSRFHS